MKPEVHGIHHIEMYVINHKQASHFYRSTLGLVPLDHSEPSVGANHISLPLWRENINLLLTAPTAASGAVAEDIHRHGEGIKDVALSVSNVDHLFVAAVERGAKSIETPSLVHGPWGTFRTACIGTCGNLVHSLMEGIGESSTVSKDLTSVTTSAPGFDSRLTAIDHIALAVNPGELEKWVEFYVSALGLQNTYEQSVRTEYSGMNSTVVQASNGAVRFPMMEAASGRRKSQIETYVSSHQGPGAQHLAFLSNDIVASVSAMVAVGVEFLPTPATYYDTLEARVGDPGLDLRLIKSLGILVDREDDGLLYQIFTKPVGSRPTLFLEVIERRGAQGFGAGNIRALFEAVERTQVAVNSGN